jgi:Uma2 family endonuclease
MSVEQKMMTAEDLWEKPEIPGKRFELVDGELVEMPGAGMVHNLIAAVIYGFIRDFVQANDLGWAFTDGLGYVLSRDPDQVRIPDASYLAHERLPDGRVVESFAPAAPNLAVEVVSPNDSATELQEKVQDYLDAGIQAVWIVWPKLRSVTVHLPDGSSRVRGVGSDLEGGDILPGFSIPIASIFESID